MLHGKRFIICGLNRLAVRVARSLVAGRATVILLRRAADTVGLARLLPPDVRVVDMAAGEGDDAAALREAGAAGATSVLALSDDDLDNLRVAVAAREAAPEVAVVLRAFEPGLADQLEQGLNIRRAYSVSALAAPAFLAAACGNEVLETLRLAEGEVPLCRLTVRPLSPLVGQTVAQIKARFGCAVVARDAGAGDWQPVRGDGKDILVSEGDHVLMGGPLTHVLRVICLNIGWLGGGRRRARRTARAAPAPKRAARPTALPYVAAALVAVLLLSVAVFSRALHLRLVDAVYFVVTTATTTGYGDITLKDSPDWVKLFGCVIMLSGGALLGIVFSYLAALATAERLDQTMGRRAGRMNGHVVVAGLGNLGYRVARLLSDLGLGVVVLEMNAEARFAEAVRAHAPVLTGDARLPENLERASVGQAAAFLACTNDDLANIHACLHARRLNPTARTVARLFDDTLAERLPDAFAINKALSASQCAVTAFVGAATDERALRSLQVGSLRLIACRCTATDPVPPDTLRQWRAQGVRVLAWRAPGGSLQPASDLPFSLASGDEVILCGPSQAVQDITAALSAAQAAATYLRD